MNSSLDVVILLTGAFLALWSLVMLLAAGVLVSRAESVKLSFIYLLILLPAAIAIALISWKLPLLLS